MKGRFVLFLAVMLFTVALAVAATHVYEVQNRPAPLKPPNVFPLLVGEEQGCREWVHVMVVRNLSPLPLRLEQSLEKEARIDQMGRSAAYEIAPYDSVRVFAHSPYHVFYAPTDQWLGMFNGRS